MMCDFEYIVIVIDNHVLAKSLNGIFAKLTTTHFKIQAVSNGQAMVGFRHGHSRPTLVIDLMRDRDREGFTDWYKHCVEQSSVKARLIKVFE
jgi:hypothetical protein